MLYFAFNFLTTMQATSYPGRDMVCGRCGTVFLHPPNFERHLLKHPDGRPTTWAPTAPEVGPRAPSPKPQSPALLSVDVQFSAIKGDLRHKTDVYALFNTFGPSIDRYFSNKSQADYLRAHRPDLIPSPELNDHSLGTIFEDNYERDIAFRACYITHLHDNL